MSNLSDDIEISATGQIRNETSNTADNDRASERRGRSMMSRFRRRRAFTLISPDKKSTDHHYTPLPVQPHSSLSPVARQRSSTYAFGASLDNLPRAVEEFTDDNRQITQRNNVIMTGWLYKTTRPKTSKTRGHRQHRQFRLTAHSLEYEQFFQKVYVASYLCVIAAHTYPLHIAIASCMIW